MIVTKRIIIPFLLLLFVSSISYAQSNDRNVGIIPAPNSVKLTKGEFVFSRESGIVYEKPEDKEIAELFQIFLKEKYFLDIPLAKNFARAPKGIIRFSSAEYKGANAEGYSLTITPGQINVSGKGPGLFYGLQSLMQILPLEKEGAPKIPCAEIVDAPRYKYRGMHLDVVRHMFPVPFIKKYIDLLAQYKINTFHWHLTDDQGWRLEIKKYPKLTTVGGYRDETLIGYYYDQWPQIFDNTPYGGYYTQEEAKEVVAYAAKKFITVIPEIEMPGHALAALTAYPNLGCGDNPGPFKVTGNFGVFDDIFCAGKEETFKFLEDVVAEVIAIFPSQYIHVGGDEAPKTRWKECKYCQNRIQTNKLKDEHHLQSYFVQRMEKFINSKGRKIIGWDEILEGGLAPNATVMSWRGTEGGIAAAKQDHDAIMTPGNFLYFDHLQGSYLDEPVSIGGLTTLSEVYSYNPTPAGLTPKQQDHIIGVQSNLWTEYIKTPQKVEYSILPRMFALSEIAWTKLENKNYKNFSEERVPVHLAKLDQTNTIYRVPEVHGALDTTLIGGEFTFTLKPLVKGARVYYNLDSRVPRETDYLYEKPVTIKVPKGEKRVLKSVVITPSGKRSAVTTTFLNNEEALPAAAIAAQTPGLRFYVVPGLFKSVFQIDTAKSVVKGVTSKIDLSKAKDAGRAYGVVFDGYINILNDGEYTFKSNSDDGSVIIIDDKLIVENDHQHSGYEKTGSLRLSKGLHKIQIRYFQINGGDLSVKMADKTGKTSDIAANLLFH